MAATMPNKIRRFRLLIWPLIRLLALVAARLFCLGVHNFGLSLGEKSSKYLPT